MVNDYIGVLDMLTSGHAANGQGMKILWVKECANPATG